MLIILAAMLQGIPVPPPPPLPPPFSPPVQAEAVRLGKAYLAANEPCQNAQHFAYGRRVEALKTPAYSAEWKIAQNASRDALAACIEYEFALERFEAFMHNVGQTGSVEDRRLAQPSLDGIPRMLSAQRMRRIHETGVLRYIEAHGEWKPAPPSDSIAR